MHDPTETLIDLALAEDIGTGDVTSRYFVAEDREAQALVTARAVGVISGATIAARVFKKVDLGMEVEILIDDGSRVGAGAVVLRVAGKARAILAAERTALNFLQHLSGIATLASQYAACVKGTRAIILDTRKTTPGYRLLEKQAVVDGGCSNHRMGLHDRIMVKDNHLAANGSDDAIREAVKRIRKEIPHIEVELEADTLAQVERFLAIEGVDHILLDNMSSEQMREAVNLRGDRQSPWFEASGGVNLETVREIAATGVDFISVGAITHSAPALDIGLDFIPA
jgi:nicotinate-nucleotide pyrophosphorylase (carboxylating)